MSLPVFVVEQLAKHVGGLTCQVVDPGAPFGGMLHLVDKSLAGRNLEVKLLIERRGRRVLEGDAVLADAHRRSRQFLQFFEYAEAWTL